MTAERKTLEQASAEFRWAIADVLMDIARALVTKASRLTDDRPWGDPSGGWRRVR